MHGQIVPTHKATLTLILLLVTSLCALLGAQNKDILTTTQDMPFLLSQLTYQSDVPFDQTECAHLVKLEPGAFVTNAQLASAYRRLSEKKRFQTIQFEQIPTACGTHLHIRLEGSWLVGHVHIQGILFGRHHYQNLYQQQPGQVFDEFLHQESLKAIQANLIDQGYMLHRVTDKFKRRNDRKLIDVRVRIRKGPCFGIGFFTTKISTTAHHRQWPDINLQELACTLYTNFTQPLQGTRYLKKALEKQSRKIKTYLKTLGFINPRVRFSRSIDVEKRNVHILFNVILGSRRTVSIQGNHTFSDDQIRALLLSEEQPDWLLEAPLLAEQLSYEYYKKGFWQADIDVQPIANDLYYINIEEGLETRIGAVRLVDASDGTTQHHASLVPPVPADQDYLNNYLADIATSYRTQGFWDFSVTQEQFVKTAQDFYEVRATTEKGTQRLWAGLSIDGCPELASNSFFKKYRVPRKSAHVPFNQQWLAAQRQCITETLYQQHYWYPKITVNLKEVASLKEDAATNVNQQVLHAQWTVDKGKQTQFGHIVLQGTTRVPFARIATQIKCKEGNVWNKQKIDLTRKRLKSLGIFQSVQVWPHNLSKEHHKKPIIVQLIDDEPVELRLRAGYYLTNQNFQFKQQQTPKLGGSLVIKNPTNHADNIAAHFDWTRFERKIAAQYQYPGPFGTSIMSQIKLYSDHYIHPVRIRNGDSAYEGTQHGIALSLYDDFGKHVAWNITLGNEWLKTDRVRGNLKLSPHLINHTVPYLFAQPECTIDFLDDQVNTRSGNNTNISLKLMFPEDRGSTTAKLLVDHTLFVPLGTCAVLALHGRFGHIIRRTFENIMPMERFYLGGPNSVRGYEIDSLPPYGQSIRILPNGNSETQFTVQGGSTMVNANAELRFDLLWGFGGVLFQDIGILSQTGLAGLSKRWYPSSGFGLRYQTPVGPVRFDIGWKWKKRLPHESSWGWHLSLGQAF